MGCKTGKHTDLLIMAEQLGDQGSLSKNLQERGGADYRRARLVWATQDSSLSIWILFGRSFAWLPQDGSLLPGLALLRTCSLHSCWHHGLLPISFLLGRQPSQKHRSETIPRTTFSWTLWNFRAIYAAQDIQPFRGKVLEKITVRGPWIRRDLGLEKEQ